MIFLRVGQGGKPCSPRLPGPRLPSAGAFDFAELSKTAAASGRRVLSSTRALQGVLRKRVVRKPHLFASGEGR
jgi:hypothetical protein